MFRFSFAEKVLAARGFADPASSGRFSAFHFGIPPSSTRTFSDPNARNVHHTRAAPYRPMPS